MRNPTLTPALGLSVLLALAGCSEATTSPQEDTTTERDTGSTPGTERDTGGTPSDDVDVVEEPDTATEDTAPDTEEDVALEDTAPEDTGPPAGCDALEDECEPNTAFCSADLQARILCGRCGVILSEVACAADEICDENAGAAFCRPCEGSECGSDVACVPDSRTCQDHATVQICGSDGSVSATQRCPNGRECIGGVCGSEGNTTGETCSQNIDPATGCTGHLCICGSEYTAEFGTSDCAGALSNGFCSKSSCADDGCGPDEICLDLRVNGSLNGDDICVLQGNCAEAGRSCGDGLVCSELPVRASVGAPLTWELGCWTAPLPQISDECSSDADCVGGSCRTRSVSGGQRSYCSMPCSSDAACPSNAVCAQDPESSGSFICMARGEAEDCPRLDTQPLWVRTRRVELLDGGVADVCWFAG